jgi:oxalate decarboxylase/phosphoglucose isomerase-like protein (cupin superfamily)
MFFLKTRIHSWTNIVTSRFATVSQAGDISFVPQGYVHWIENIGNGPLHFLVMLSNEEPETIELSEIMASAPKATLAKALGLSKAVMDQIPTKKVMIAEGSVL